MKYLLGILIIVGLASCQPSGTAQSLSQLDKKSAREVALQTVTQGDSVLHITIQNIWYNGEQIVSHRDTLVTALKPDTWERVDSISDLSKVPIYVTVQ